MTTIYLPDPTWTADDEQYWWAIMEPSYPILVWRPAFETLRTLPDWSDGFYDQ
jgi:hypothetical protein